MRSFCILLLILIYLTTWLLITDPDNSISTTWLLKTDSENSVLTTWLLKPDFEDSATWLFLTDPEASTTWLMLTDSENTVFIYYNLDFCHKLGYVKMSLLRADGICCIKNCNSTRQNSILHKFPNPDKDPMRFRTWTNAIGGNLFMLDDSKVYKMRYVCHKHFEPKYYTRSKYLTNNAVPRLHLKEPSSQPIVLQDITNVARQSNEYAQPSTSKGSLLLDNADAVPHTLASSGTRKRKLFGKENKNLRLKLPNLKRKTKSTN